MSELDPTIKLNNDVDNEILKARSPIILSMDTNENTSNINIDVGLYIWNGLKSAKPTASTYNLSLTDNSFQVGDVIRFDLSSYTKEFIDANDSTQGSDDACWFDISLTYSYTGTTSSEIFTQSFSNMVVNGYATYKNDDKEAESFYLPSDTIYVPQGRSHELTFLDKGIIGTRDIDNIEIEYDNNIIATYSFGATSSDPNTSELFITYSVQIPIGANSGTLTTKLGTASVSTYTFKELLCTKYDTYQVGYYDKNGKINYMWFNGVSTETQSVEQEIFRPILSMDANGQYNESKGSTEILSVNGNEEIELNSNFVPESYKEMVRELLLSEYVYLRDEIDDSQSEGIYSYLTNDGFDLSDTSCNTSEIENLGGNINQFDVEDTSFTYVDYPVIPNERNIQMLKHINEKLINYTINFKRAYNTRNDIF